MAWKLHEGDCLEILPRLPEGSVDAVVTDPPFVMAGAASNGRHDLADDQFFLYWFTDVWKALERVVRDNGHAFVFCDWRTVGLVAKAINRTSWSAQQALMWDREGCGMGTPFRNSFEMLVYARGPKASRPAAIGNDTPNVIRFPWYYGRHKWHPAEKPVGLLRQLLEWLEPSSVIDPFAGSGSTLVAAEDLKLDSIGIEKDPEHCETIRKRLARNQLRMVF